jgi:hypothetical protein
MQDAPKVVAEIAQNSSIALEPGMTPAELESARKALTERVCGSPAVDGYSHVKPECLEKSPTAKWWESYYAKGGKQGELIVWMEKGGDYDGLAVAWGLGNKKETAEDCAKACLAHMPNTIGGPYTKLPCNSFTWCPEDICFEPDAHKHTKGDCWLKFTEGPAYPELNMRGELPADYRQRHQRPGNPSYDAPKFVQWWGGVLLPRGIEPTNGTYGPRWKW